MWNLAIDFGTSNTTGATWSDGVVEPVEVGRDRRVPSVVLLSDDGTWVVGREADNQSVVVPERVERAPKRRIGKGRTLLLGGRAVPISSAVAALLGPHVAAARVGHGGEPNHLVLTHPARWGPERFDVLREAAQGAGFSRIELLPEPVAAAHFVDDRLEVGQHVAVYDLGGGTFDTCVMRRTESSFRVIGLPGGTERIGGEDFDHRMYQHLGAAVAREDPAAWEAMTTSDDRKWRRAAADLLTQGREAKEQLSRNPRASVYVGSIERDITVTRDEFESLITVDVDRTVDEMSRTIDAAGLADADIVKVYLVGGSSRLPLVQQRMGERFGDRVGTWDDPKGAVVLGAAKFSATLEAPRVGAPAGTGGPAAPVPTGPVVVGAPPPRTGPVASPTRAPTAPATNAPTHDPGYGVAPVAAASHPPAPAYGAPSPAPGGKVPGGDQMLYAWIGAASFLVCCLPGPAVGAYFANEAKKQGHPQAQLGLILNVVAAGLILIFYFFYFLSVLASSG